MGFWQLTPRFFPRHRFSIYATPRQHTDMAIQGVTSARQRYNLLAAQNATSGSATSHFNFRDDKRPAKATLITYSRKDRPLSLTADQFMRSDTYDLPSDGDDEALGRHEEASAKHAGSKSSSMSGLLDADGIEDALLQAVNRAKPDTPSTLHADRSMPNQPPNGRSGHGISHFHPTKSKTSPKQPKPTTCKPRREGAKSTSLKQVVDVPKKGQPRRLPVGELLCVPSLQEDVTLGSSNNVSDTASHNACLQSTKTVDTKQARSVNTTSATAIRKRLVVAKLKTKKLRRKRTEQDVLFGSYRPLIRNGDGFEASEMTTTDRPKATRRTRKFQSAMAIRSLALSDGPLPEVTFDCLTDALQLETSGEGRELTTGSEHGEQLQARPTTSASISKRRVSFSNHLELIKAQLSSVKAMRRPTDSESEGEDAEVEDEDVVVEGFEAVDHGEAGEHSDGEADSNAQSHISVSKQSQLRRNALASVEAIEEDSDVAYGGITLRYPRSAQPPIRRRLSGANLNEVKETIEDVLPHPEKPVRRRSILKNSAQAVPEGDFLPEHTEANTRRNSMVVLEDSRYFSDAMEGLAAPNPAKHHIVPRRLSRYEEVQEQNGEQADVETSSQPLDYMDSGTTMSILRATNENVYASQAIPGPPKSLKALTRSVSREHGTLSQSMRRRSSLTFQVSVIR